MNNIRILFSFILVMMLTTCPGWAQEDNVFTAASALEGVLSNLKDSIEKLSIDNNQLAAKDKFIKQQVAQLQAQLGDLEAHGDILNKAASQLQNNNPRLSRQINRLEEESSDLDVRIQKTQDAIKSIQSYLDEGYHEDQKLLLRLKDLSSAKPAPLNVQSPEYQALARHQKEKLKLMKMIYDSQQKQESLHEAILDYKKDTALLPAASALARQQLLKEQIKNLEDQIAAYPPEKSSASLGFADQWDDTHLRLLESELKELEKNYLQLKDLMDKMSKKAQSSRKTASQYSEEEKLQNSADDLNRQNAALKADLDDLRNQMIELDKRKSYLEMMTQRS